MTPRPIHSRVTRERQPRRLTTQQRTRPHLPISRRRGTHRPASTPNPTDPLRTRRRQPQAVGEPSRLRLSLLPSLQKRRHATHPVREHVPDRPIRSLPNTARMLRNIHRQDIPTHRHTEPHTIPAKNSERLPLGQERSRRKRYATRYGRSVTPFPRPEPLLTLRVRPVNPLTHPKPRSEDASLCGPPICDQTLDPALGQVIPDPLDLAQPCGSQRPRCG
jgi:hypothetical protein